MFHRKVKMTGVTYPEVFQRALQILNMRDHSVSELRNKLEQRFEAKELIEQALQECLKLKYLDDARFTQSYVRQLTRKGKSKFLMTQELKKRGVASELISRYVAQNATSDFDTALEGATRKQKSFAHLAGEKQKMKLANFLKSRGFSGEVVYKVFRALDLDEGSE